MRRYRGVISAQLRTFSRRSEFFKMNRIARSGAYQVKREAALPLRAEWLLKVRSWDGQRTEQAHIRASLGHIVGPLIEQTRFGIRSR